MDGQIVHSVERRSSDEPATLSPPDPVSDLMMFFRNALDLLK